ncbi:ROK family protein [Enterovirga aerilata]|uniref:ROK family protein n=1 Tax=Enterovirga aerilata TaxID=2730920 RepID=A0A849IFC4_9HYPH|nr:ROK family protein [Enterovirga sp. DB1703]NNM74830.1 ROK family protein [Enterovirga sp. DB1703]
MLVGIDWGGTKIEGICLSGDGEILARRRVATPRGDYEACIAAIADLVAGLEAAAGLRGTVGVGIPGAISPRTGLIMNANSTWNIGRPLDRDLERALGREVRVENDANCFAVSEAVDGAGAGCAVVWGVILGTGAGSGIAIDGRALGGHNRIAGEWGHNPLPRPRDDERPGPACYCGRHGCNETFVSGTGFERDFRERTGRTLPGPDIVQLMRSGNRAARDAYEAYLDRLGRGLASVVNVLDPDIIVLGGGMSNVEELYLDLPSRIAPHVFSDSFTTPVVMHRHGDSSGVRGAAWLWK